MTRDEKIAALNRFPMPEGAERIPTGAVAFGDDWPGYFWRGDNVMGLQGDMAYVEYILDELEAGRIPDTRPSTMMMARSACRKIRAMSKCLLVDDREEGTKR